MAKVLVIGSGGREHALCYKFALSKHVEEVFVAPGNGGMSDVATLVNIDSMDFEKLMAFVKSEEIDLTFVGPEIPLCAGIVDAFEKEKLCIFGPSKLASQLEGSKCFSKDMMKKYQIPTAAYESFTDYETARAYLSSQKMPIVLKADGLAAGKGVIIANTMDEAQSALKEMMCDHLFADAGSSLVIEEYLEGEEFSLFAFVKGERVIPMQIAQDHKRAFDNDEGLNTGGMGAYTPVDHFSEEVVQEAIDRVMQPIANAMVQEGMPYVGVLYGGFMATTEGVKTIEFNCRFGDPESEVVLQAMEDDLYEVIMKVIKDEPVELHWSNQYYVGVVLASEGYPGEYLKGINLEHVQLDSPTLFHMGSKVINEQLVSSGGRVLFVSGRGNTIVEAKKQAYETIEKIKAEGLFYRSDIADKEINKRL